jgi:hypothetical protein
MTRARIGVAVVAAACAGFATVESARAQCAT